MCAQVAMRSSCLGTSDLQCSIYLALELLGVPDAVSYLQSPKSRSVRCSAPTRSTDQGLAELPPSNHDLQRSPVNIRD